MKNLSLIALDNRWRQHELNIPRKPCGVKPLIKKGPKPFRLLPFVLNQCLRKKEGENDALLQWRTVSQQSLDFNNLHIMCFVLE